MEWTLAFSLRNGARAKGASGISTRTASSTESISGCFVLSGARVHNASRGEVNRLDGRVESLFAGHSFGDEEQNCLSGFRAGLGMCLSGFGRRGAQ